jgi:EmrB/QacA subfamily drug resistance transporter
MHRPLTDDTSDSASAAPVDHAAARSIIVGIMLAMFLSALDQTIVAPALPTIGRSLGDAQALAWVMTAYLLSTTVATPLFGKLSDIYGRRAMLLISLGVFVLGSIACALAPSMGALIAARALQGLGGGGILPLAQTVIADLLTPRERPLVQSYSSAMFLAACFLGPLLGGVLTDYVHWSLIFWINVPLGFVALWLTDRSLRRLPRNDRPHKLDVVGAALMVLAALALLLALNGGGERYAFASAPVIGLFGLSLLLWLAFVWRIARAPEPFIPLSMMREPVVFGIVVAGFFSIGTIIGLSIFMPLYVELVLGMSASASGFALIALMCGATLGSMLAGRLMTHFEHYKRVPLIALAIGMATLAAFAFWPGERSLASVVALLTIAGAGLGPMYPTTTVVIQNAVAPRYFGIATGTLNFFRQLGGAIIVAIFAAIVVGGAGGDGLSHDVLAGASGERLVAVFRWVFLAATIFTALAFVALAAIEERPLRGPAQAPAAAE